MMDSVHGFFLFPSRRELLLFEGGGTFSSAMTIGKGIVILTVTSSMDLISELERDSRVSHGEAL